MSESVFTSGRQAEEDSKAGQKSERGVGSASALGPEAQERGSGERAGPSPSPPLGGGRAGGPATGPGEPGDASRDRRESAETTSREPPLRLTRPRAEPGSPRPAVPTSGREALREHLHGGDARHLYLAVIVPVPVQKQEPAADRGVRATALRGSRHPVPGEKHPPSPLVAGKTADHRVRLLGVPESHEEGGSCGGAQT